MDVVFSPQASFELSDAAASYEATRRGLGKDFVGEVDAALMRLCRHPCGTPSAGGSFRRGAVFRFPFTIVYRADASRLLVIGLLPTRADCEQRFAQLVAGSRH